MTSRLAQFRLIHIAYVFTLLACGLATFGAGGIILATPLCVFWGFVFTSRSRPRTFTSICLLILGILLAFGLLGFASLAMAYSPRSAVHRMVCSNNLKQIAIALHNYHDAYGSFPPAYVADSSGRPMHSWRVLILPFLKEVKLYKQYAFDEPWDGPNNRKLLNHMPQIYACPSAIEHGKPTNHTLFVLLALFPLPWVWLNPTSGLGTSVAPRTPVSSR